MWRDPEELITYGFVLTSPALDISKKVTLLYSRERQQHWCIKINLFSFLFFLLPKMYGGVRVRKSRWWLSLHTQEQMVQNFCKTFLPFFFGLSWSKSSLVYIIFWMPMQIPMVIPSIHMLHVDTLLSSMPPTQCTWSRFFLACNPCNFCSISARGSASCLL